MRVMEWKVSVILYGGDNVYEHRKLIECRLPLTIWREPNGDERKEGIGWRPSIRKTYQRLMKCKILREQTVVVESLAACQPV